MSLPRRYTYAEAAEKLDVKESWLRQHIRRLPHIKLGRTVWFTDEHLARILQIHTHEPTAPQPVVAAPSPVGAHPLADLKPIPLRGRRASA
jgi:hypothetical protein